MVEVERVTRLETVMEQLIFQTDRSSKAIESLTTEMKEFKDEMKEFKDEMKEFKDTTQEYRDDMKKMWGGLANQLGRVVEDLVIPNIDILISNYFDDEIEEYFADVYKRHVVTNDGRQFDGIITTKKYIFIFEIKNQVGQEYVDNFRSFIDSNELFQYFDQYKDKKIVPVMGSINLKQHQVRMLTEAKILALSIKGDILTFNNYNQLHSLLVKE